MNPSSDDIQTFCAALDSIDDLVDEINAEGAVVSEPADMARILARLGSKFVEVADVAPDHLENGIRDAARMFIDGAQALESGSPEVSVARAQLVFGEAMTGVEKAGLGVREFREEHCADRESDRDSTDL